MVSTVNKDLLLEDLLCTLKLFLTNCLEKTLSKVTAISQSTMQCAWPLSLMMPFSLFLGVFLHSRYGSRYLGEKVSQFGVCKGYHEKLWYRISTALASEKSEVFVHENQTTKFPAGKFTLPYAEFKDGLPIP